MDTVQLSKNDFHFLLIFAALVPIICLGAGFYIANNLIIPNYAIAHNSTDTVNDQTNNLPEDQPKETLESKGAAKFGRLKNIKAVSDSTQLTERKNSDFFSVLEKNNYAVQAGIFSTHTNATRFQDKLQDQGVDTQMIYSPINGEHRYRIVLSSFGTLGDAKVFLGSVDNKNKLDLFVTRLNGTDFLETLPVY